MSESVVIVAYDPRWSVMYEEEKGFLLNLLGDALAAVEHIGSTAIPGLGAKPIIDIMAAVRRLADTEACIPALARGGYEYAPEFEVVIPERRFFRKGPPGARTHHLHVVELTSEFWDRHLLFRDYLRAHPDVAEEYLQLKKALAVRFAADRPSYTEAKTDFIQGVVHKALVAREAARSIGGG
ncbi:MAG: GrpB family protein [Anaerolineae bacterium]|nr:GrpB family protein [Anaerolineae bacterium]